MATAGLIATVEASVAVTEEGEISISLSNLQDVALVQARDSNIIKAFLDRQGIEVAIIEWQDDAHILFFDEPNAVIYKLKYQADISLVRQALLKEKYSKYD